MRDNMAQDGKRHVEWLAKEPADGRPIWCQEHYADIPASRAWPRAEINEWFRTQGGLEPAPLGYYADDYWTSTPGQMLGHAIWAGYEEIHLYGIDMLQAEEYCIGPDERVLTADLRWVPAGELKVGQQLVAFDEDAPRGRGALRRWQPSEVEVVQRLRRPSRRIHLADGTTIMCSAEHRWLVRSGNGILWRTTDELVYPGHKRYQEGRPSRLMKLLDTWIEDRSWDAGYMAAALDGEGTLCQTPHYENGGVNMKLSFAQRDNAMAREFMAAAERLGFKFTKSCTANNVSNRATCYQYNLNGGRTEALRLLGTLRPRRLLEVFNPSALGFLRIEGINEDAVPVAYVEDIGEQEVIGLRTSTRTFIAEGFATHNSYQRSGCEYYVAFARARGIKVYVPPTSALCKANYTYGYTEPPTDIQHLQPYLDYLGTKVQESNLNKEKAASAAATIDGGLQAFRIILTLVKDGILVRDKEAPPGEGGLHPVVQDADGNPTRRPCVLADIRAECEEQLTKLEPKQREALNTVVAMDGQIAGFQCSRSWAEHYARGGKLA